MSLDVNRQEIVGQLRDLFGYRGHTGFELGEQIIPVANIADLDAPPFHSKNGGIASVTQAAVAAQYSFIGIRAPTKTEAPTFRAVIRFLLHDAGAAEDIYIRPVNSAIIDVALGAPTSNIGASWENSGSDIGNSDPQPQARIINLSSVTDYLSISTSLRLRGTLAQQRLDGPFVLNPGTTLLVQGKTLNTALSASFYWDEYTVG